jgi:hypothetical protein
MNTTSNNNVQQQQHPPELTSSSSVVVMNDTEMILHPPTLQSNESTSSMMMNEDDVFITNTTATTIPSSQQSTNEVVRMDESITAGPTTAAATAATTVPPTSTVPLLSSSLTTTTSSTTTRYDTFTEAVPLSLSSMAHLNIPLTDGVVDGIIQVIHHTLIQCVNYISRLHTTSSSTSTRNPVSFFTDIATTPYAWIPIKDDNPKNIQQHLPHVLQRMNFVHLYSRNAFIYYKPKLPNPNTYTKQMEEDLWKKMNWNSNGNSSSNSDWYVADDSTTSGSNHSSTTSNNGILGRIRLFYCSPEPLTPGELNGTDTDEDDMPPCVLYQMMVEYCSTAPTGNMHAVQAEELSMLSFGSGSIDDDIKYGALASLYDELAKYVLEIYSVRGKKYKFDLMDSTLANGTVPHIPILRNAPSSGSSSNKTDPFLKNLCVTVTDHHLPISKEQEPDSSAAITETKDMMSDSSSSKNNMPTNSTIAKKKGTAVTRIYLTLEGKLRTKSCSSSETKVNNATTTDASILTNTNATTSDSVLQDVPAFDYLKNVISYAFLRLNPNPSDMVQAHPSGHTLLLDPDVAGHIYINGRYAMTWGDDSGISASHGTALFGIDLHSIPFWNGRIVDYELVKEAYAQLWHEILIDAKLQHLNIASRLLHRLIKGVDSTTTTILEEDNDLYDDTDDDDDNVTSADTHLDCLESLVLAAPNYDRVGIAAKALATRFAMEFGKTAFPCLAHETEWVKHTLPNREPIVVPQRLINILRRGGYFDVQKTVDLLWFTESRPIQDEFEMEIINIAVQYLEIAGCIDVDSENIVLVSSPVADNVIAKDAVCRWDPTSEQFYVHEDFFKASINDLIGGGSNSLIAADDATSNISPQNIKGYLLGMYIAKAHPVGYGKVLARYLIRNKL